MLLEKLSNGPRHVLNLPAVKIEEGELAKLTLLDTGLKWEYNQESNISKSINSPLLGHILTGKSVGIINGENPIFRAKYEKRRFKIYRVPVSRHFL